MFKLSIYLTISFKSLEQQRRKRDWRYIALPYKDYTHIHTHIPTSHRCVIEKLLKFNVKPQDSYQPWVN